ncbi:N/A [soil metagenome]
MTRPWRRTRALLGPLLTPLYAAAIARRNARFDRGRGVSRAALPVISIGNLSTGGTGKTPFVMWLARALRAHAFVPAIAMRGYASAHGLSDEADEYRRALPDVPVIVNPDRAAGIAAFLAAQDAESGSISQAHPALRPTHIILDDGFQHRRLARDADIVLIDATRDPRRDHFLPRGDLREPLSSLRRAHAIILTRCQQAAPAALDDLEHALRAAAPAALILRARSELTAFRLEPAGTPLEPADLRARRILALSAIGNPAAFLAHLHAALGNPDPALIRELALPDHDLFTDATINRAIAAARNHRADFIIATEKDWSKLARIPASRWPAPLAIALSRTVITTADEAALLALILARCAARV